MKNRVLCGKAGLLQVVTGLEAVETDPRIRPGVFPVRFVISDKIRADQKTVSRAQVPGAVFYLEKSFSAVDEVNEIMVPHGWSVTMAGGAFL